MVNSGRAPIYEPGLEELLREAIATKRLSAGDDYSVLSKCDMVLLTVGTPLSKAGDADLSAVEVACEAIAPVLRDGQLVVLKSTVPPGVTERIAAPLLRQRADVHVAFCPERLAEGAALRDLKTIPIVVGGVDPESTALACDLLARAIGVDCHPVAGATEAEFAKLADNLWIDLNIALANELAKVADTLQIDVLEVIKAANTLPKGQGAVNILIPSLGVGGSCLTKDPWFVERFAEARGVSLALPGAGRAVNDGMPAYSIARIREALRIQFPGAAPDALKVCVLGVAFKSDTSDCRHTPTKPAIEALAAEGYRLALHDPLISEEDGRLVTDLPFDASLEAALDGANCVSFFTGHAPFLALTPDDLAAAMAPGGVVFDGRIFFNRAFINALKDRGLIYVGVGRS
jgi:UDP-N-acetyl-D-mannosaminuronic acid dehydrogenase